MKPLRFFVAALLLALLPVRAQSPNDPVRILHEEYAQADAELNKVYQALLKKLNEKGKAKLRESQRAWLAYRDAEAAFVVSQAEGNGGRMANPASLKETTEQRIKQLKSDFPE